MKKNSIKKGQDVKTEETNNLDVNGEASDEKADINSIQEFIELKKLQNRILGKMIEKINKPEN